MSDEEEEETQIEPMPPHKIRMTDLPDHLVEKAIRGIEKLNAGHKLDKDCATSISKYLNFQPPPSGPDGSDASKARKVWTEFHA